VPARRPTLRTVAVTAAVALGALLVAPRLRDAPDGGRITPVARPAPSAPAAAGAAPPSDALPSGVLPAPFLSPRWERHARQALEDWIAAGPRAATVTSADRDTLVAALGELRRAALASRRRGRDGTWQARQSARIAAADRVFRDTVGQGLSEFLAVVSAPEHVVDLGAAARP
jgi:hypothetical protein